MSKTSIAYARGDLLTANTQALVNPVNCVGVMGKGLALQFKQRFPENFVAYREACARGAVSIGSMFVTEQLAERRYIINFPTKRHWRQPSTLHYIDAGLIDLVRVIRQRHIESVAIPPLGAGLGGLNWADVHSQIIHAFNDLPQVRAVIFPPAADSTDPTFKPL